MPYLSQDALEALGFAALGRNVKISDKASVYDADRICIGDNSRIDDFCVISGKVDIGRNVHIAPYCLVAGGLLGICLEDFTGLAYRVSIFAQSDDYSGGTMTNPTVPHQYKSETKMPVRLGRHVIVGASAVITPGVDVSDGCAIGAMSLVLQATEPWGIYAGVPATLRKPRKKDVLALEAKYLEQDKLDFDSPDKHK